MKAGKFAWVESITTRTGPQADLHPATAVPVLLCKDLFINEDSSSKAVQYLLCTDLTLSFQQITTTYQKRWGIEKYPKSLKKNTAVAKAPVKASNTQANHLFASICAFVKLERLKINNNMNHFARKTKLYIKATQAAFHELAQLKLKLA